MPMDIVTSNLGPKEQLIENLKEKIKSIEARLRENESIMSQNQLEVDRIQQQHSNAGSVLERVKANFDSVPRDDIMKAYERSLDTTRKLFTMRTQLEKLQDTQNYLREFRDKLLEVSQNLDEVALDRLGSGSNGSQGYQLSLAGEQVVRMLNAQESERRSLATALHDGPTQSLSNFILQAEICQRLFDRDPATANTELNNLKGQANAAFQKMREFIFELRPMMLDDLGLVATLRRHAETHNQKYEDKTVEFHVSGPDTRRFPPHVEVLMFRAVQALLNNSLNVLNGKMISIKLNVDTDDHRLTTVLEDNGRHVDVETELDPNQGVSPLHNILDLRERIEIIGGKLDFFSTEDGNIAEINLPYDESAIPA